MPIATKIEKNGSANIPSAGSNPDAVTVILKIGTNSPENTK